MLVAKKEEASKALVAFTGNNFQFEKINKAIEKLGTVENLTKEEKENGVELVAEWNKLTIKRIEAKTRDLANLLATLEIAGNYFQFEKIKEELEKFALISNLSNQYHILEDLHETIEKKQQNKPLDYEFDDDLTRNENLLKQQEQIKERIIFDQQHKRSVKHFEKEFRDFLKKINDEKEIQAAIKQAKTFLRNSEKFVNQCKDKAAAAKLNIMISNKELKSALKEMLDFSMEAETF